VEVYDARDDTPSPVGKKGIHQVFIKSSFALLFVVGSRGHVADPLSVQLPDFLGTQGLAEQGELVHTATQVANGNGDDQAIVDDPEFLTQNRKNCEHTG
jgi:hypothetical protein